MSLTPNKSPVNLSGDAALVDTFCKVCFWGVGGLAVIWMGAMVFAVFG